MRHIVLHIHRCKYFVAHLALVTEGFRKSLSEAHCFGRRDHVVL
jgi:hypothetical protein